MSDEFDEIDPEDAAEAARERELYVQRVEYLNRQLAPWRGGNVIAESYSFGPTDSPLLSMPQNSILSFLLAAAGGKAHLRCFASWKVSFITLWINAHIEASYQETGIARLVISDGERLHVECLDAEVVAEPPNDPGA